MNSRNFSVQAFFYGPDGSIELWFQKYFTTHEEALYTLRILFPKYDQVTISKVK